MSATVLIVADTPDDQATLAHIVSEAGYEVSRSCSGAEVLDGPIESRPDFVLLDVAKDDMDGFRVCRELSNHPLMQDVPVIMISDTVQNVDRLWAEQQGVNALVPKPYTTEQLVDQLRRLS